MTRHKIALKPAGEIVVFVTAASEEEAARIGRSVVEEGLAACANVVPRIRSIFRWEGKVSEEQESLIILKTRADLFEELAAAIKGAHSYQVPEIIALPIGKGSADYLKWIRDMTSNKTKSNKN
jgi:periplasmic divalent cation tolerance protein